jgi:xylulokinase
MARLIGLDIGTSAVKGVAVDGDGAVVAVAERGYPLSMPRPGWSEQDPEDWWRAAAAVLRECGAGRADGIGLSGQMHGLVALDARDRPVRPAILWNDGRARDQCRRIEARLGLEGLVARTGNRALAGCTAPSLLWVREHEPDAHARIRSILLPKDYVRLRLCGERATDVVDASGTLLFDVARRAWSAEVLDALEIDPAWLPRVAESPEPAGTAGRATVAAGAGDEAAAAVGAGVLRAGGPACVGLGTSGVVMAPLDAYAADPLGRAHAYCHAVPGGWNVLGVMLSAGASLRWLRDVLGREVPFARLMDEAAACEPGAEGLRFAPHLAGERMPDPDPEARGAFVGLGLRHGRGELVRAVLEGVAFGLRDALELVSAVAGPQTAARICGGGGRSSLWLRIIASVLDLPLEVCHAQEGAAYGAALLGGVAAGVWAGVPEAVAGVRVGETIEPDPEWVERYAGMRAGYRALRPALERIRGAAEPLMTPTA